MYKSGSFVSINAVTTLYSLSKHLKIPVFVNKAEQQRYALLDCGSMGNFIHERVVTQLGLVRTLRSPIEPLDVKGVNLDS